MNSTFHRSETCWRLRAGGLELTVDRKTGCLSRLVVLRDKEIVWTEHAGDVTVRDDRLEKTFGARHLDQVRFEEKQNALTIRKTFRGAPWLLEESYRLEADALAWEARVTLDTGEDRSCEIRFALPWPQPLYPMNWWAATERMPSAPHRFAGVSLEYGEITAGTLIPALVCYRSDPKLGLTLAMPFDFRTPRFRFLSGYRDPDLAASFDWLALAPGKPARAKLLLRGGEPDWRPALGWLYERYQEYFEPRSTLIHKLWGGHISGSFDVSPEDARQLIALGLKWYEVHAHFPAYGNYHPEGMESWRSGHERKNAKLITVDLVRRTIRRLHEAGAAALLYMQLSGDGDEKLLDPRFAGDRIRNWHGDLWSAWPGTLLMNSDPSLAFGRDITRQIDGIVQRYPEMDGVFVDQPGYSFLDTAHDDGLTAVNNRPCYLTSWNFAPHLEHLSRLLHPSKAIIGNGPFAIWQMKYLDGVMAEGSEWLNDKLQYYTIGQKPLFFLEYSANERRIERMFQQCLFYGAGFTSYPAAMPSKDLYDRYLPLLQRLFRRRWVFDPDPLHLPPCFKGNLYRSERGTLIASVLSDLPRASGRPKGPCPFAVRAQGVEEVAEVTLQLPGGEPQPVGFSRANGEIHGDLPGDLAIGLIEFHSPRGNA